MRRWLPRPTVLVALTLLTLIWYGASIPMNHNVAQRLNKGDELTGQSLVAATWSLKRPVLPAPHQIAVELWQTTVAKEITSKRSLIYHAWRSLVPTVLGFLLGTLIGILLATAIVLHRAIDRSILPWVIASQTIPILALAPMIIVVLGAIGFTGLLPKSIISMYLSFFPITIGMVKGLRSPDPMLLDLMRSYSATQRDILIKLRLPASLPYLFTSMKISVAAALVGTIVGELPTGAQGGLGARLLSGSYYGQTIQIWAALFIAAIAGALLVGIVNFVERRARTRMGLPT